VLLEVRSAVLRGPRSALAAFSLIWSSPDVGLFSINVGPFSSNLVLSGPSFSVNVVRE